MEEPQLEQVSLLKTNLKEYPLEERQPAIDQTPQWFDVETHTTANMVLHTTKTYINNVMPARILFLGRLLAL